MSVVSNRAVGRTGFRSGALPLLELPIAATVLALAAGSLDGYTFFSAHSFATVQSGNVIQVGYWIAESNMTKVGNMALAILAFGLGAMATAFIRGFWERHGRVVSPHILVGEAVILAVFGLPFVGNDIKPLIVAYVVSFVAGMQGNAFHKSEGMTVGNVAVTLNVQLAFNFLARSLFGSAPENLRKAGVYAIVLVGFAGGAVIGGVAAHHTDVKALWIPAAILLAMALVSLGSAKHDRVVDPAE